MLSVIHSIAARATAEGINIGGSGNGWLTLAAACGYETSNRRLARNFLLHRYGAQRLPSEGEIAVQECNRDAVQAFLRQIG